MSMWCINFIAWRQKSITSNKTESEIAYHEFRIFYMKKRGHLQKFVCTIVVFP